MFVIHVCISDTKAAGASHVDHTALRCRCCAAFYLTCVYPCGSPRCSSTPRGLTTYTPANAERVQTFISSIDCPPLCGYLGRGPYITLRAVSPGSAGARLQHALSEGSKRTLDSSLPRVCLRVQPITACLSPPMHHVCCVHPSIILSALCLTGVAGVCWSQS